MQRLISFMRQDSHDPILIGNYSANMAVGYYPREAVQKLLPRAMSIPSDKVMNEKYPTVTVSFLNRTYFYTTRVFSLTKVIDTSPVYEWNYKGSVIKNNENTFGNYSEFTFTISKSMRYKAYFHPTD